MATLSIWPSVLHALVQGEQIAVLVDAEPTVGAELSLTADATGERPELLKPAYRRWAGDAADLGAPTATVVGTAPVDAATAGAVAGKAIWTEGYGDALAGPGRWVAALRVRGEGGDPVLSDVAFDSRLKGLVGELPDGAWSGPRPA
jgi:hypothetical protein